MWIDPETDGCIHDEVDCYHLCRGCRYAYKDLGGEYPEDVDIDEDVNIEE